MKRLIGTVALGLAACSIPNDCAPPVGTPVNLDESQLNAMRARQEEHNNRLEELSREIAASELKAQQAKAEAEFLECRALQARIDSEVSSKEALCANDAAEFQLCRADNAKRAGDQTLLGCLGGIAVAAVTGGGGAPLALGGCGLGAVSGAASAVECSVPQCASDRTVIETSILAEHGLAERPHCGDDPGFEVQAALRKTTGVRVDAVGPGSAALAAGLAPGDTIVELDGKPTTSCDDLRGARLMRRRSAGTDRGAPDPNVDIKFVRNRTLYGGSSRLLERDFRGRASSKLQLGVKCGGPTVVEHLGGTTIASIEPEGAAARAGLRVGDVIVAARAVGETEEPAPLTAGVSPPMVARFLDGLKAGQSVRFTIHRGKETREVDLVLEPSHAT